MDRKNNIPMNFGPLIKTAREAVGMTQEQMMEAVGVSDTTIQKWETGQTVPDISRWKAIIDTLRIPADEWYRAMNLGPVPAKSKPAADLMAPAEPAGSSGLQAEEEDAGRKMPYPKTDEEFTMRSTRAVDDPDYNEIYYKAYSKHVAEQCDEIADDIFSSGLKARSAYEGYAAGEEGRGRKKYQPYTPAGMEAAGFGLRALIKAIGLYIVNNEPMEAPEPKNPPRHRSLATFRQMLLEWTESSSDRPDAKCRLDYLFGEAAWVPKPGSSYDSLLNPSMGKKCADFFSVESEYYRSYIKCCKAGSTGKTGVQVKTVIQMMIRDALPMMDIEDFFDEADRIACSKVNAAMNRFRIPSSY